MRVPETPVTADGPSTDLELELPAGVPELEVTISPSGPAAGGDEPAGSWVFELPEPGASVIRIEWLAEPAERVRLSLGSHERTASEAWADPEAMLWPDMAVRFRCGGESAEVRVKIASTELLKRYYQSESHQQQYVVEHPFFESFHRGRLRCLEGLFRGYIEPGSRVLDVGSGYGIFYMISESWDLDITCCDLDTAAMEKMRGLAPQWNWVVADALHLPWGDASFDAVYAGEIIEHVPRPEEALSEWGRVLAGGGILILSTPNRDRLLARANGAVMPVHHEHLVEMNLAELRSCARAAGFKVLAVTGVYMEFLVNWWRPPGRRVDLLTARLGHPRYRFLYTAAMEMGRVAPSLAFDLVMVCRKR